MQLPNRTIFCHDNLEVLQGIDSNTIDLIYLDPPFNKQKVFTAPIGSSAEGAQFRDWFREEDIKDEWVLSIKEDYDGLHKFLSSVRELSSLGAKEGSKHYLYNYCYLVYMAMRLLELRRILKETGSIYLHCDSTIGHYIKILLDIIFGENNFRNEIVWDYKKISNTKGKRFNRRYDTLFFYVKSELFTFNHLYTEISQRKKQLLKQGYNTKNMKGKKYIYIYDEEVVAKKKIDLSKYDKIKYVDADKGTLQSNVFNIDNANPQSKEFTNYPTQKPLALLERIIKASSNEGDFVLDPFCGCATTCIAAEKLNRRWIGIDVSVKAYELVKKRLQREVADPKNLFQYDNQINFSVTPPKRTDKNLDEVEQKYVYIISHPKYPGEYKVGIAKNCDQRVSNYQTSGPDRKYKLEYSLRTPLFRSIEKHIHTKFENKHEWVRAKLEDIIFEIENYNQT